MLSLSFAASVLAVFISCCLYSLLATSICCLYPLLPTSICCLYPLLAVSLAACILCCLHPFAVCLALGCCWHSECTDVRFRSWGLSPCVGFTGHQSAEAVCLGDCYAGACLLIPIQLVLSCGPPCTNVYDQRLKLYLDTHRMH